MRKTLFLLLILSLTQLSFAQDDIPVAANLPLREKNPDVLYPISVEYPHENMTYAKTSKGAFVFGSIANPKASLVINNVSVPVYKNGGFLTFLPIEAGEFKFVLDVIEGDKITTAARTVFVQSQDVDKLKAAELEVSTISPRLDVWGRPGDSVEFSAYGAPESEVYVTIKGLKDAKNILLKETQRGFYKGSYKIDREDKAKAAKIIFKIVDPVTKKKEKKVAPGKLRILTPKDEIYAEIKDTTSRIRRLPVTSGSVFPFYQIQGTVKINGKIGEMYRIDLGGLHYGWIEGAKLKFMQKEEVLNSISTVVVEDQDVKTRIVFYGVKKAPVLINSLAKAFELTLFYTDSPMPVIQAPSGSLVESIVLDKMEDNITAFKINYKEGEILWGYDYAFDDNGNLVLELMHKPVLTPLPDQPLKGAKIMLDPGHSPKRQPPYDGAVGPTGKLEYELNMLVVKELTPKLTALGAEVIVTKNEKEQLSLQNRISRTINSGAHLLVSVHYNALPDDVNPFGSARGFTIYYFHGHSRNFAQKMNKAFERNVKLANNGALRGELYMVRPSQFPSILTENSFIMFPEQEDMAADKEKRAAFVQAIYEGILSFYEVKEPAKTTPAQAKRPARKTPAKNKAKK
ncbi:N-acetylmuramoyl-L-alanine amidase [Elusimicrobium posterum]|uniref:N-acetylmuramoyl-L-alanine amidase family protein n=1 Tax=Elusimicrobium posterum TaxID=3116653 RepID=UPI003C7124BA